MMQRSIQRPRNTAESMARAIPTISSPKKIGSISIRDAHIPLQSTSLIGVLVRSVSPKLKKETYGNSL